MISWPENPEAHVPTSILGVLRLRAINPLLSDRSARRFAQDDGFVVSFEKIVVGCVRMQGSKKSQLPDGTGRAALPLNVMAVMTASRARAWVQSG